MTTETELVGDEDDVDFATSTTSLEVAAESRKRRLQEMKAKVEGAESMERQTDEDSDDDGKPVLFRSYAPLDSGLGTKRETKNLFVLEKEIQDQLADTDDMSIVERVDVGVLAPRKVDWDLKRDVAERLQKLERRTQKAIATLIKERLSKGQTELVEAVNSGAYSTFQDDE
ncbi:unnamed protein product [Enterobius vermicularis]|uniref:Coiled-coil domain-containing protein 12 n=1 Tax=Enterobius vermicularis TaxID=51028 RepID=A0A0N4V9G4_ENTVE|nr:unnamed protein product [Enterobius vermicularis]